MYELNYKNPLSRRVFYEYNYEFYIISCNRLKTKNYTCVSSTSMLNLFQECERLQNRLSLILTNPIQTEHTATVI